MEFTVFPKCHDQLFHISQTSNKDNAENAVTVNGVRYRNMTSDFFWEQFEGIDIEDLWFQQDGATCHTSRETMQLLRGKFPGRIISRNGDINWPPRSCDLTPIDFFLGYLRSRVYRNKPNTIPELKREIRREIAGIEPQLYQKVIGNFNNRITLCHMSRGGHLNHLSYLIVIH
ncbi:uncharacterized protein LOC132703290 [Cylas formicarius]|uniref:uncharacterized protein LOC132703290 n=1 Tax=Cylas formicarius TaxID=197179 RepID=UPI0029583765|nr:uncharacterized protein LOC132703290 [Cylas formicarius]